LKVQLLAGEPEAVSGLCLRAIHQRGEEVVRHDCGRRAAVIDPGAVQQGLAEVPVHVAVGLTPEQAKAFLLVSLDQCDEAPIMGGLGKRKHTYAIKDRVVVVTAFGVDVGSVVEG
jgi:hypothetical protein